MAKPYLPNVDALVGMGIDPKTGLPVKFSNPDNELKNDIRRQLRVIDEQDFVNRYTWYNIPMNITSQDIERMLYYRGQLLFFYSPTDEKFYLLPYAVEGSLDVYGRAETVHPIPFNGTENQALYDYLSTVKLDVVYAPNVDGTGNVERSGVILKDYTNQLSVNTIIPRVSLQDSLLDTMAGCIPYMNTNLLVNCGIKGIRVNDPDQKQEVDSANKLFKKYSQEGKPYVPIVGQIEFQDLGTGVGVTKSEEFMLAMQSLDNYRLSTYGLDNGGLFEKKAQELQSEADLNGQKCNLVLQDGLAWRQNFCTIINSIWGLGIWCDINENISMMDVEGDGMYNNDEDGNSGGVDYESSDDSTI